MHNRSSKFVPVADCNSCRRRCLWQGAHCRLSKLCRHHQHLASGARAVAPLSLSHSPLLMPCAHAGEFNDHVFEGLDFVLAEARRRGILVILTLVNYWGDYGGMPQVRLNSIAACASAAACSATLRTPPVRRPALHPHGCDIDGECLTAGTDTACRRLTHSLLCSYSTPSGVRLPGAATRGAPSPSTFTRTPGRRTSSATTWPR